VGDTGLTGEGLFLLSILPGSFFFGGGSDRDDAHNNTFPCRMPEAAARAKMARKLPFPSMANGTMDLADSC
jgi:hypothetical protein